MPFVYEAVAHRAGARGAGVLGDRMVCDRSAGGGQPSFPFTGSGWLLVGGEQEGAAQRAVAVLGLESLTPRGLLTDKTTQVIIAGHTFMQNLRRGHYKLAIDAPPATRVAAAFTELARAI